MWETHACQDDAVKRGERRQVCKLGMRVTTHAPVPTRNVPTTRLPASTGLAAPQAAFAGTLSL